MTRDKILAALKGGPQTTEQLMQLLSYSYDRAHNSVKRLVANGRVVRLGDKRYALIDQAQLIAGVWLLKATVPQTKPAKTFVFGPLNNPTVIVPTPPDAPAPAPTKVKRNEFIVLVDHSGSMGAIRNTALEGLNKTLRDIQVGAGLSGQPTTVSLYEFDHVVQRKYVRRPAEQVREEESFWIDGTTALFDAVELGIKDHVTPSRPDDDVAYVVIAITDGGDNASRDRTGRTMTELMRTVSNTDRWTITFQVPRGYKNQFVHNFGVPDGNVIEWDNTKKGAEAAATARSVATESYFKARTAGATKSTSFYADLSNVSSADLQRNLKNISHEVKFWQVDKEQDIESFVESKLGAGNFARGTVFYQFTKPEKVQAYKKLLVTEKQTKAVYAGPEVRKVLGLPDGDINLKPGNMANFDIFGQSTSNNRILVRGTKLAYWPGGIT